MKSVAALAVFLSALVLLGLGDTRRSARDLRAQVSRSEASLAEARTEVEPLRRAPLPLKTREPRDPARLQHDILGPSVQVNVQGSVGGGTLLFSRDTHSYVIPACHVIQKLLIAGGDGETRAPAEVTIYDDGGASTDTVEADLVA